MGTGAWRKRSGSYDLKFEASIYYSPPMTEVRLSPEHVCFSYKSDMPVVSESSRYDEAMTGPVG